MECAQCLVNSMLYSSLIFLPSMSPRTCNAAIIYLHVARNSDYHEIQARESCYVAVEWVAVAGCITLLLNLSPACSHMGFSPGAHRLPRLRFCLYSEVL